MIYHGPLANVTALFVTLFSGHQEDKVEFGIFRGAIEMFPNLKHFSFGQPRTSWEHAGTHPDSLQIMCSDTSDSSQCLTCEHSRRLETFEVWVPYCPDLWLPHDESEKLLDWSSLTTLSLGYPRNLALFLSEAPNLKRLNLITTASDSFDELWNLCLINFPLLKDFRMNDVRAELSSESAGLPLIGSSNLRCFMWDVYLLPDTVSGWKWTEFATACPNLDTLGIFITTQAHADDWLTDILDALPNLKTLLLFVSCVVGDSSSSRPSGLLSRTPMAILRPGSTVAQACENFDLLQQQKVGCLLESVMFVHRVFPDKLTYRQYFEHSENFGFPGIRYSILGNSMLEVTRYGLRGEDIRVIDRKYGPWKPKPRSVSKTRI
ncbi:hypothetical protein EV356DRAFT_182560 [Viridothelium virens]|uniref:F-box domain-containing protein n=1 Tax=Viridothelium virens TaxID=1048519 RepID=A0A6A6H7I7_VIRVR|nr:hypothetical protein EV356DRAFT_182560 [Viridothelium virens]